MEEFLTFNTMWLWPWIGPTWNTVAHHSSTSTYTPNFTRIRESFCGWTDRRTDIRTDGHRDRHRGQLY